MTVQTQVDGIQAIADSRPIWISTIASAKGLEFRALHIAGLDLINKCGPQQKKLAFTGITRAKTSLDLYHQAALPGYLRGAIHALHPVSKPPSMGDVFGKR
jgi:hypothetical protein